LPRYDGCTAMIVITLYRKMAQAPAQKLYR